LFRARPTVVPLVELAFLNAARAAPPARSFAKDRLHAGLE